MILKAQTQRQLKIKLSFHWFMNIIGNSRDMVPSFFLIIEKYSMYDRY